MVWTIVCMILTHRNGCLHDYLHDLRNQSMAPVLRKFIYTICIICLWHQSWGNFSGKSWKVPVKKSVWQHGCVTGIGLCIGDGLLWTKSGSNVTVSKFNFMFKSKFSLSFICHWFSLALLEYNQPNSKAVCRATVPHCTVPLASLQHIDSMICAGSYGRFEPWDFPLASQWQTPPTATGSATGSVHRSSHTATLLGHWAVCDSQPSQPVWAQSHWFKASWFES